MQSVQSLTRCCLLVLLLSALCVSPLPLGASQPLPQQLNTERGIPKDFDPCNRLCAQGNPTDDCKQRVCPTPPDVTETQREGTELSMAP
nr:conotoxin precursor J [Conus judaeus]